MADFPASPVARAVLRRHTIKSWSCVFVVLVITSVSVACPDCLSADEPDDPSLLTIEVVDGDGNPVEGALLGQRIVSTVAGETPLLYGYGDTEQHQMTNEDGQFHLTDAEIAGQLKDQELVICACHPQRKLIAIERLTAKDLGTTRRITVGPGCDVMTNVISSEAETLGYPIKGRVVMTSQDGIVCSYTQSNESPISQFLPPGNFIQWVSSSTMTNSEEHELTIAANERSHEVNIDLKASPLARMIGQPAVELTIREWKNGVPVSLKDQRGKVILLDFWGHWCGPCVYRMPHLFELHDELEDQGLVIIAIHDDSVASIKEMDEKLATARKDLWEGRDIPFLVALDSGGKTKIEGSELEIDGATTAAYGIGRFPTYVLINRDGIVVGPVEPSTDEGRTKIVELLKAE